MIRLLSRLSILFTRLAVLAGLVLACNQKPNAFESKGNPPVLATNTTEAEATWPNCLQTVTQLPDSVRVLAALSAVSCLSCNLRFVRWAQDSTQLARHRVALLLVQQTGTPPKLELPASAWVRSVHSPRACPAVHDLSAVQLFERPVGQPDGPWVATARLAPKADSTQFWQTLLGE
jgi:hypothetical protein